MMSSLLVVVDVQNDFCPGGALAVPGGNEIIPQINRLMADTGDVVLTQDWHPAGHISFASTHAGKAPFERITLGYGLQVLWPDHCLQGGHGAAFHKDLETSRAQMIVRKGFRSGVDSYSGFLEADRRTSTGLHGYLKDRGITRVQICGLATDFCVAWTALDARAVSLEVTVIVDACRAIDTGGSLAAAMTAMRAAGVTLQTEALK
jgi:nicotinamidase/pyrazinamidase